MTLTPHQVADLVIAAAIATLRQVAGIDPAEIDDIAKAIGNNAAMAIMFASEVIE